MAASKNRIDWALFCLRLAVGGMAFLEGFSVLRRLAFPGNLDQAMVWGLNLTEMLCGVLMVLGLPVMLVQLMADSLAIWPPGGWPDADGLAAEAIRLVARSFWIAMLLAAPFTLGGFMFQALSGVINRVMPSLPVIFIGSPAAIMLALAALALLAPVLIGLWADAVLGYMLPGAP